MTKRPKWLDRPEKNVPEHIRKAKGTGRGTSDAMHDVAFWLSDEFDHWVAALEAIDKRNDKEPLLALLKSECELPHAARIYLADLLSRYQLKKKRGGQSTPAYDRSLAEVALMLDVEAVRNLTKNGMSIKDALAKVAKPRGPDYLEILGNAQHGSRGSIRRMKKRRP
jgi:hypothetical protein